MKFRLLQRIALILWFTIVGLTAIPVGRQLITQFIGETIEATVTSRSSWTPRIGVWPRSNCHLSSNGHEYTVPNTILTCETKSRYVLKIDPFNHNRAIVYGDIFDNGTLLAWYFLALSTVFVLLGIALKLAGFEEPWRTTTLWLIDRIQGSPRKSDD